MSSSNQNLLNRFRQGVERFFGGGGDSQWMLVCLNLETGKGCRTENGPHNHNCWKCGELLRNALLVLKPGARVKRFEIVDLIGYGGYGAVYEAIDVQCVGRRVALKQTFAADHIKSFGYEFEVLSQVQHPNLPHYEGMFELAGYGYLVMEFVPGQTLLQILRKRAVPLPESLVLSYAVQLCDVLTYLHTRQPPILHRDIKPENIRLTEDGLIKLVDFGLLKLGGDNTRSSRKGWTPAYAPLEQSPTSNEPTTTRTDIYGLAAMLYHLLTGVAPMNALERLTERTNDPLPSPVALHPALSPHLSDAIMQAMQIKQADRYASADAFKQALLALPASATSDVEPVAEEEPLKKPLSPEAITRRIAAESGRCANQLEPWFSTYSITRPIAAAAQTVVRKSDPKPEPAKDPPLGIGSERVCPKDGMVQVFVPAGTFKMGSDDDDKDAWDDEKRQQASIFWLQISHFFDKDAYDKEKPQHPVHLDAYWIDKTPVTNAMFAKFVAETSYQTQAEKAKDSDTWRSKAGSGRENHPVVCVSWNDANAYCEWAGRRLPSEAEWEKAAGGTDERKWPWGNNPPTDKLCNFNWNVKDTTPVGNYPEGASPYGALDMAGNVWEWCRDTFDAGYYAKSPKNMPWNNPCNESPNGTKVLRGGSWWFSARLTRVRSRLRSGANYRDNDGGFRCACSQLDQALADYDAALRLNPNDKGLQKLRQEVYDALLKRAQTAYQQGQLYQALADYDAALRLNPHDKEAQKLRQQAYDAKHPRIGSERVCPKDGMIQLFVPAGTFQMGSRDDDKDAWDDEKPQHPVHLDAYWIDKTPVTNAMFAKFVAETRYQTEAEKDGWAVAYTGSSWEVINGANWRHPRGPSSNVSGKDNHPVVCVSWNDANAYCEWAGRRLPSEAEWEKAAGGTDERKWPWGNEPPTDKLCNFNENVKDTTPVGNYPEGASPYRALDMAGNVWEWCRDTFDAGYYAKSPKNMPWNNPCNESLDGTKVLRGGSWWFAARVARVRSRGRNDANGRGEGRGFRCARSHL